MNARLVPNKMLSHYKIAEFDRHNNYAITNKFYHTEKKKAADHYSTLKDLK
jgi:hypothetical protein